ncbi:MAG: ribosome maturation factor RimP [Acidimicrobiia bacterium]|nr:ribosome maturation factor RimP [Acidimicrobiia bacterium]MDH5615484.1 ribosome maturation factor RimP [Acidimicrobiia bacterium]
MSRVPDDLWELLSGYLQAEGLELDDLEMIGRERGSVLRVTLDMDGGVGVDRLAETSRGLSRLLDEDDRFQEAYTLEVTSPGLERKLRRPEHFAKSIGREVAVKTHQEVEGERTHRGTLESVDEVDCVIAVEDTDRRIPLAAIASARTVFRWEPAAKPGAKGR